MWKIEKNIELSGDAIMKINILVFSLNRACQCDLLLRTIKDKFEPDSVIQVLYKATEEKYEKGYEKLKEDHPHIQLIKENNFQSEYKSLVSEFKNKYCLFLTDDDVFIASVSVSGIEKMINKFESNNQIHSMSLRMNTTINHCFPAHRDIKKPSSFLEAGEFIIWNWKECEPHWCWGYPHAINSHLYNSRDFSILLMHKEFHNPNSLEVSINRSRNHNKPLMISFSESKIFNVQNNFVQGSRSNEVNKVFSVEDLNKMYLDGKSISTENIYGLKRTMAHGYLDYIIK